MIEKLIEGRYNDLDLNTMNLKPGPVATAKPPGGSFVDSTPIPFAIQQSVTEKAGIFSSTKTRVFAPGLDQAKVHRNFHWLKRIPPYIAHIPLDSVDIFTGPMSGCWVITYKWPGGAGDPICVGHLGTRGTKDWDDTIKAGWNQVAEQNPAALVSGFQPNRAWAEDL